MEQNSSNNYFDISGFVPFDSDGTRVVDKVTITKSYQVGFPAAMFKKNNLDAYGAARMYWNKESMQIGIEFLRENADGAFKLIRSGDYGAYIVAKSFMVFNEINPLMVVGRYTYQKVTLPSASANSGGELYIISLNEHNKEDSS